MEKETKPISVGLLSDEDVRQEIISLLSSTNREGVEETIQYLRHSNFFRASCHTHHKREGGLARHSLEACRWALEHAGAIPKDSVVIAALLHDTCSAYSSKARGIGGHGRRSVRILKEICHLGLTKEENEAIRLHMHREALHLSSNPLAALVWKADKTSAAGRVRL